MTVFRPAIHQGYQSLVKPAEQAAIRSLRENTASMPQHEMSAIEANVLLKRLIRKYSAPAPQTPVAHPSTRSDAFMGQTYAQSHPSGLNASTGHSPIANQDSFRQQAPSAPQKAPPSPVYELEGDTPPKKAVDNSKRPSPFENAAKQVNWLESV